MADTPVGAADNTAVKVNGQDECVLQRLWDSTVEGISDAWSTVKRVVTGDDPEADKQHLAKGGDLPPGVPGNSRNVDGVLDTVANHMYNPEYSVERTAGMNGQLRAVKDSSGNDVRRFSYNERGALKEVVLPNGSYLTGDGIRWRFKDRYDNISPTEMEWMSVDRSGNVSFDNPAIGARVTLTPDEQTIISYWHRNDWAERAAWSKVEKNEAGLIRHVVDFQGRPLREFSYESGNLVKVQNADRTSWHTADGGKTWIFTEADRKETSYADLDLKVDSRGNVGYNLGGRKIVELANGVNMISPPADWNRRYIDQFTLTSFLKIA